jgi:hypothetical protein
MMGVPARQEQRYKARRMRVAVMILGLLVLCACGAAPPLRSLAAIADLATGSSRSRAEGGQCPKVTPPDGVSWTASLDGYAPADAPPRFECTIALSDRAVAAGTWRLAIDADEAELVDDEGHRFPCRQARVPIAPGDRRKGPGEPAEASWVLVFTLPAGYRHGAITGAALHWRLRVEGQPALAITTLFRA